MSLARPAILPWGCVALVLLLTVALPRLMAIGWFPHLDEGFYGFLAQYIAAFALAHKAFPPDIAGYQLYASLLAPLAALPVNQLILFRAADLLFALLAGYCFCRMLVNESGSARLGLALAAVFLLGLNLPQAIDSGFKNSFMPAFACLFGAISLVYGANDRSKVWFYAGFLTALGVLLRETFAPFALLGCVALLGRPKALWRFVLGGVTGAISLTLVLVLIRGQVWQLFSMYFNSGAVYGAEASRRWPKFLANGQYALLYYWPLLALAAFLGFSALRKAKLDGRAIFWLAAALLPVLEPLLKLGFLYHFSACLPGLAGLAAWSGKNCAPKMLGRELLACGLAFCLLLPPLIPQAQKLPVTMRTLQEPGWQWPRELAGQSNTLAAREAIMRHLGTAGSFSSSGFAYFLFPTTGHLPPRAQLADLSRTWIMAAGNAGRFAELLAGAEPELAVIVKAVDEHSATFAPMLSAWFADAPGWSKLETIEPDEQKNYGWLGYTIFKRNNISGADSHDGAGISH